MIDNINEITRLLNKIVGGALVLRLSSVFHESSTNFEITYQENDSLILIYQKDRSKCSVDHFRQAKEHLNEVYEKAKNGRKQFLEKNKYKNFQRLDNKEIEAICQFIERGGNFKNKKTEETDESEFEEESPELRD